MIQNSGPTPPPPTHTHTYVVQANPHPNHLIIPIFPRFHPLLDLEWWGLVEQQPHHPSIIAQLYM